MGLRRDHGFVGVDRDHDSPILSVFPNGRVFIGALFTVGDFRILFEFQYLVAEQLVRSGTAVDAGFLQ